MAINFFIPISKPISSHQIHASVFTVPAIPSNKAHDIIHHTALPTIRIGAHGSCALSQNTQMTVNSRNIAIRVLRRTDRAMRFK